MPSDGHLWGEASLLVESSSLGLPPGRGRGAAALLPCLGLSPSSVQSLVSTKFSLLLGSAAHFVHLSRPKTPDKTPWTGASRSTSHEYREWGIKLGQKELLIGVILHHAWEDKHKGKGERSVTRRLQARYIASGQVG